MAANSDGQVVKDVGKWDWSELVKKEDWWAIWLGFFILLAGAILYFPQAGAMKAKLMDAEAKYSQAAQRTDKFKTIAWYQMYDAKKKVKSKDVPAGKFMSKFSKKTHKWTTNPLDAFFMSKEKADAKKAKAVVKYDKAKASAAEALALATAARARAFIHGRDYVVPEDRALVAQELLLFENAGSDDVEDFVECQLVLHSGAGLVEAGATAQIAAAGAHKDALGSRQEIRTAAINRPV